ncbi:MAG TPA: hypothetical protein VGX25_31070 [Actinophytocola sp.]|uniref:hypothetical protein n=1 Tax=Actinophytocola sp. TaxID=1872138 RepID=UPI002DDCAF17|nr:hypothetical protein [Actinophytocola sp.]HEV2783850.1 hypothetical protein [Actinophytocola sp.]
MAITGVPGQDGVVREEVEAVRAVWDAVSRDGGRACGLDVAADAYNAMQAAWFDELGVYLAAGEPDGQ